MIPTITSVLLFADATVWAWMSVTRVKNVKPLEEDNIRSTKVALHQVAGYDLVAEFNAFQPVTQGMIQARD